MFVLIDSKNIFHKLQTEKAKNVTKFWSEKKLMNQSTVPFQLKKMQIISITEIPPKMKRSSF